MGDQIVHQDLDYAKIGQRCDTTLMTEDGTVFHVNSELLSKHSIFFYIIFPMYKEAGKIPMIRHIKPDILDIMLTYMNTGKVLLTTENVINLLVASDSLIIKSLVDECRKFVLLERRVQNLVSYFLTANRLKGLDIGDKCRRFLVLCFEKAVMHFMDEVCRLSCVDLVYFLSHRSLNVSDEQTIWSVIEAWVQKQPVIRRLFVPEMLRCLSIHEIGDELASNILSSSIIRSNIFYRDVGDPRETFDFLSDVMKAQSVILFRNQLPIITELRLPRFLHVVAKLFKGKYGAELYISYDDSLDLWRKIGEISLKVSRILVSGHLVYYLKHVDGHYEFNGFFYDLLSNEEKSMALPHCIDYVVGKVGGSVYALQICRTNIERYAYETDEWVDVKRDTFRGFVSGALNVNGLLYVIGEVNGNNRVFMRVYDPSKDEWGTVPSPIVRRFFAESAVYQGKIFLVAGQIINEENESDEDLKECEEDCEVGCNKDCDDECNEDEKREVDDGEEIDEDDEEIDKDDEEIVEDDEEIDEDDEEFNEDDEEIDEDDGEIDEDDEEEIDEDDKRERLFLLKLKKLGILFKIIVLEVLTYIDNLNDDKEEQEPDGDNNEFEDALSEVLHINAFNYNMEEAMFNIEQDKSISKAVEVYDPKRNEWVNYPELPFRFSPVHVSVVKDRLYVYQNPQRPVTYWDGSGQWKIEKDPSWLFQHKFSAVKDENVMRQIMRRNKEEDPTVWLETGLEKPFPN